MIDLKACFESRIFDAMERGDFESLVSRVEEQAAPIHNVLITPVFNAGVTQVIGHLSRGHTRA